MHYTPKLLTLLSNDTYRMKVPTYIGNLIFLKYVYIKVTQKGLS